MVALQSARGLFWDSERDPAFGYQRLKVVVLERLPVFYADEGLDFARLAGLLAKSQNSCRDLAGDMAGRLAFSLLGLSDEVWREGQAHQEKRPIFVGFEYGRWGTILLHGLQHLWDAGAAAFSCEHALQVSGLDSRYLGKA